MVSGLPETVISQAVERALAEDVGSGDITTLATVEEKRSSKAEIVAKAEGVIAGLELAEAIFRALDPRVKFESAVEEGERVAAGTVVARVEGATGAILTGERSALNFLQRMSGIATLTAQYVAAVEGTKARVCDTRKTAPGLRALDKYAVRAGGGWNHRAGLFDGVLIKDNHIKAAGGIAEAVARTRKAAQHLAKVEVETTTLAEVQEAVEAGAEVVMLDNMGAAEMARAVELVGGRCEIEASGKVNLETVRAVAECGVDYISVGALTHSAPALDISLEIVGE